MREIFYSEAIREALFEEMRKDSRVFVMGEDVGLFGNIFKVTKGLIDEFGAERVRDTPISENAIVGAALGSSMLGMKPVIEIMYMDFLNEAADQLLNHVPKIHFMSGGKLKTHLVIRTQYSLGRSTGAQHSQFFPIFYMNTPYIQVAVPSTPYDAKGLLKTAIRGDNPTLFIECASLYRTRGPVPEEEFTVPFGKADIKREGTDATVIAISRLVPVALVAAELLAKEGVNVEVLDPRTLIPLDKETMVASVKKTGRLITVEDCHKTCGIGAELSAMVMEEAFDYLDAPVVRLASPDVPVPFTPPLQSAFMLNEDDIVKAAKKLVM